MNPTPVPSRRDVRLIAYAKANPGKLSYASPGVGTIPHLSVERLKQLTGIELVHVPYRGGAPALQAPLANDVQLLSVGWGLGRSHVEAGLLRALAVTAAQREPNIPLPTAIEGGVPDFVASNWWGLAAPQGTAALVLDKIYRSVLAALADKTMQQRLDEQGFAPRGDARQKFLDDTKAEAKIWEETISRGKLAIR